MPRDSMQEVVYDCIQRLGGASIDRIKEATGLGHSTIRRHLDSLLEAKRIGRTREPVGKSGRPADFYKTL